MPSSGLFITLYDEETLSLYLDRELYGFLMPPVLEKLSPFSKHYAALADYACVRNGTHVFFFLKRKIVYGGQAIGSEDFGAFYLNGPYSPMGKKVNSTVSWDESKRNRYEATERNGVFRVRDVCEKCQPYLIRFKDNLGLKGRGITSDQLYFELGKYSYPLPSNSISGMGFCTLTPGETNIALKLLEEDSTCSAAVESKENVQLEAEPVPFKPEYGILDLEKAFSDELFINEAHLEATVLSNPKILPIEMRPVKATLCRQVPVSPFKPFQMDRADICYYFDKAIADGTLPNVLIELKRRNADLGAIEQVQRYLKWLYLVLKDDASQISVYLLANSFSCGKESLPKQYRQQVHFINPSGVSKVQRKLVG